ncbi:unnamed protein product [Notodromas monacha]|uniref:ubiquitinyl hydrolase 1 n=1 Tax=Notodromas monacha TaxID=399045 RepID=A0A7R9BGG1_9CRUS|nr:unnamed protein product [Notodromas monacha]CAG0913712.1 unnamed protein product [Notodromas monacha]
MSSGKRVPVDHDQKWSCSQCTYENWPSARKCTMCNAVKSSRMIPRDIFELSALEEHSPSIGNVDCNNPEKWSCPACTFLNWNRNACCVQCRTVKSVPNSMLPVVPAQNNRNGRLSPSLASPRLPSPVPDDVRALAEKLQGLSCSSSLKKWTCLRCTYDNYPKAVKCVLCHACRTFDDHLNHESSRSPSISRSETPTKTDASIYCPQGATADPDCDNTIETHKRGRVGKRKLREVDWSWLEACKAVIDGLAEPVITYVKSGGDPAKQISRQDALLLNQPSLTGSSLVHLCLKFKREALLAMVFDALEERRGRNGLKRMPSVIAPGLAKEIRKHVENSLRYKPGPCPGQFFSECALFGLPQELVALSPAVQGHLWEELLDREAQRELEEPEESSPPAINWLPDVMIESGEYSRLFALWNRTAGDCLLDACMQAAWGICDREGTLRRTLSETLTQSTALFYPRWQEYECLQAGLLGYALNQRQLCSEWTAVVRSAAQPGASLCQIHVFVLAHIFRRPIIVYGVKSIKSFRGEVLGTAHFEGVYLPLLWDHSFCWKSPLTLGYTRGHFSALVPLLPFDGASGVNVPGAATPIEDIAGPRRRPGGYRVTNYIPLVTADGKLLPVHFLTHSELGHEDRILRQWLDVCLLDHGGLLVAEQQIPRPHLLVAQMLEEWLNYYRQLSEMYTAPFRVKGPLSGQSSVIDNGSDSE